MAVANPTADAHAVALTVPPADERFLRRLFEMALGGVRDELDHYPAGMPAPTHLHREEQIYERLLAALGGEPLAPDGATRQLLRELTEMNDRENEHARAVAEHDALLALRGQLGG